MNEPMNHSTMRKHPDWHVRVGNPDGRGGVSTTARGYLAEFDQAIREAKAEALREVADKIGPYPLYDPAITDPATGEYVRGASMAIVLAPDGDDAAIVRGYLRRVADNYENGAES